MNLKGAFCDICCTYAPASENEERAGDSDRVVESRTEGGSMRINPPLIPLRFRQENEIYYVATPGNISYKRKGKNIQERLKLVT